MKRLILLLVFCLLIAPIMAVELKENFQDYATTGDWVIFASTSSGNLVQDSTTGNVYWGNTIPGVSDEYVENAVANPMGYAATDFMLSGSSHAYVTLYSSTHTLIQELQTPGNIASGTWHRLEMRVDDSLSFTPSFYMDGVLVATGVPMITNPSYVRFKSTFSGNSMSIDNLVYSTSNTHTTSPPPVNWTIVRDFINPSATGVWALNAAGTSYVLQNSNAFYVTAVSSQFGATHPLSEAFRLYKADGTIVNSTQVTIGSPATYPRQVIAYSVNPSDGSAYFFNNPAVTDGLYYAAFANTTPLTQDYFFVTSSGGFINFDKTSYIVGDPGTITWSMSAGYYTPGTHTYQYAIKDIYGNTVHSSTITSATGSDTITFDAATYAQGVYYVYLEATTKSVPTTTSILGTDSMTLLDYTTFHGVVYDALTTLPLPGALVNFSQLGTVQQVTVPASAEYSLSTFVTGSRINVSVTNAGYAEYNYTFIPLRNVNVSLDFALVPLPTNSTGVGIGGVAREFTYGQLIPSASITVYNVTAGTSYVRTANIRGYYQCSLAESCSLARNREYTVFGRKTGYADSANYLVVVT